MFGNGQEPPAPAQETRSIWGDMFGLGPLMKIISDPALQLHAQAMMQSIIEGANANRRMEAKLDRLLGALGHEINDINSRFPSQFQPGGHGPAGNVFAPPLLVENGANGAGRHPASTGAPDDGSGGASGSPATSVGSAGLRGDDDPAGELR